MEILIGVALVASLYGFINAAMVRLTRIDVQLPGLSNSWKGKTAVWVSDIHLGQVRNFGFAQKIATMMLDLNPDIIFIGGDLYDAETVDVDRVIEPFSRTSAPYGTYFITGNHEEFFDNTKYLQAVRRAGIRVLYNEKVELDGLQIIGVDYRDTRKDEAFRSILKKIGVDRQKPSILLKHTPFHLEAARDHGITLQLSGHTHGGQILPAQIFARLVYPRWRGFYELGDGRRLHVSRGVGTWGLRSGFWPAQRSRCSSSSRSDTKRDRAADIRQGA